MEHLKGILPVVAQTAAAKGYAPVVITSPMSRPSLAKVARSFAKEVVVLSYSEIPEDFSVNQVGEL